MPPSTWCPHILMCIFLFCLFQIRVVNAFQEPGATPAQMPFRARSSLASLASSAARLESSKSIEVKSEPPIREPAEEPRENNAESPRSPSPPSVDCDHQRAKEAETRV